MADVTLSLLTPISLRLSWSGSGDFEVWWKSDHPAGQEFAPLATVTGTTYDVGNLSWSTTYYFKVRVVGGDFGEVVEVFVCCGQAVVTGVPPTAHVLDYWQQSADPCGDKIAFHALDNDRNYSHLWLYENEEWKYIGLIDYLESGHRNDPAWYQSMTENYPSAVRMVGDRIVNRSGINFDGSYGWYRLTIRQSAANDYSVGGTLFTKNEGPNPWTDYYNPDYFRSRWVANASTPYSMELGSDGYKVSILMPYIDYDDVDDDWPYKVTLAISNDLGNTFTDEILVTSTYAYRWDDPFNASLTETSDGVLWIATWMYDPEYIPSYSNRALGIKPVYKIYKYDGSVSLARTITTDLLNTWDTNPPYYQLSWDDATANVLIYAEDEMIVICYTHGFTQVNWSSLGCDYGYNAKYWTHADISGISTVFVDVSTDSGSSWTTREVSFGETIYCHPEYKETIPAVCLADGNIIVYLLVGDGTETDPSTVGRRIVRSTDNGVTWNVVYSFAGIANFRLPHVLALRADGAHVVLTGCLVSLTDYLGEPPMALFRSIDAGATWSTMEVTPTALSVILVPTT